LSDDSQLSAILIEIESALEKAEAARVQVQSEIEGGAASGGLALPEEALRGNLDDASALLAVALDVADLTGAQSQLAERWKEFRKKGIGDTRYHPDVDWLECPSLTYLEALVKGIRLVRGRTTDAFGVYERNKLEIILRKIPVILRENDVIPASEKEMRDVVHKYLRVFFTQYTPNIQIEGPTAAFKPDAGIINLKTAIEFKYAASRAEIDTAIGEVFEDTSGYANSEDWKHFILVLYQTEAFISEDQLKVALEKASRKNWTPILVPGPGARKARQKKGAARAKK